MFQTCYSRLNDKANGKIILVMQRLHQDDLTGHLLELGEQFNIIKLPIIATEDENWMVKNRISGKVRVITRAKGELLHPERENMDVVTSIKKYLEILFLGQLQKDSTGQYIEPEYDMTYEQFLNAQKKFDDDIQNAIQEAEEEINVRVLMPWGDIENKKLIVYTLNIPDDNESNHPTK